MSMILRDKPNFCNCSRTSGYRVPEGGGGRSTLGMGMCPWDPGTLSLYQS